MPPKRTIDYFFKRVDRNGDGQLEQNNSPVGPAQAAILYWDSFGMWLGPPPAHTEAFWRRNGSWLWAVLFFPVMDISSSVRPCLDL